MVQAIQLLCTVGAKHLIEPFGIKLSQELTDPGEQILLIELAAQNVWSLLWGSGIQEAAHKECTFDWSRLSHFAATFSKGRE